MGSLRNPVGPLPSSIYWRRRVLLLSVVALLALLIVWIVTAGGGGGNHDNGADGKNPAPSITPGPSDSGPAISQAPGGRDESGSGGSNGSGSGGGSGSGDGDGSGSGDGGSGGSGSAGSGGEAGGGAQSAGASGAVGAGDALPAGSALPDCTSDTVKLSLRSVDNTYEPGRKPAFELTARNTSAGDCKVDLGPKSAVVTITRTGSDDAFWSSKDCPQGAGNLVYRVPAKSGITYTVTWDRKASAPKCATPRAGAAPAGTYLVEAKAPGFAKVQTSFVLEND